MRNKKLLILTILRVAAVLSIIYGIFFISRGRWESTSRPAAVYHDEKTQLTRRVTPAIRDAKRTEYVSWGRDPFSLPQDSAITPITPITPTTLNLNGIIWVKESPVAIINDNFVGIGDRIDGNTVVDITRDRVILNDGTNDFVLKH